MHFIFAKTINAHSVYGVIRGLHYQMPPHAQSKLVYVLQGKVLDVVVDIRRGSQYFGKHLAIELSSENRKQLFIPRGFAHGYACLSETAILAYKVDHYYNKASEASISFNDPQLAIDWQVPSDSKYYLLRIFSTPLLRQHIISTTISHTMTNVLVIGAQGQLGQSFQHWAPHFPDFEFFFKDLPQLDLLDSAVASIFYINSYRYSD